MPLTMLEMVIFVWVKIQKIQKIQRIFSKDFLNLFFSKNSKRFKESKYSH